MKTSNPPVTIGAVRQEFDGQPVWSWYVQTIGDGNDEPIAGGYCATEADALNDARVWCALNRRTIATAQR